MSMRRRKSPEQLRKLAQGQNTLLVWMAAQVEVAVAAPESRPFITHPSVVALHQASAAILNRVGLGDTPPAKLEEMFPAQPPTREKASQQKGAQLANEPLT